MVINKQRKEICIITDSALKYFKSLYNSDSNLGTLKLSVKGGGCSGFKYDLHFSNPKHPGGEFKKGDEIIEKDGIKLIIDSVAIMHVLGTTIDYKKTLAYNGITFDNPMATYKCGCGDSFAGGL